MYGDWIKMVSIHQPQIKDFATGRTQAMRQRTMIHMLLKSYTHWNGGISSDRILSRA